MWVRGADSCVCVCAWCCGRFQVGQSSLKDLYTGLQVRGHHQDDKGRMAGVVLLKAALKSTYSTSL